MDPRHARQTSIPPTIVRPNARQVSPPRAAAALGVMWVVFGVLLAGLSIMIVAMVQSAFGGPANREMEQAIAFTLYAVPYIVIGTAMLLRKAWTRVGGIVLAVMHVFPAVFFTIISGMLLLPVSVLQRHPVPLFIVGMLAFWGVPLLLSILTLRRPDVVAFLRE